MTRKISGVLFAVCPSRWSRLGPTLGLERGELRRRGVLALLLSFGLGDLGVDSWLRLCRVDD